MKIPLIAGFYQKEIVKKEGAKWDVNNKTWYIEEGGINVNLYPYLPVKYRPDKMISIIDMIPETCFYSNVRDHITKDAWKAIRDNLISASGGNCVSCGDKHGYKLEAHEIFSYKDGVQILENIVPLCRICHLCQHPGYAGVIGETGSVINKICEVYSIKKSKAEKILADSFELWEDRSSQEWLLNLDFLKKLNIEIISNERILSEHT